MCRIVGFWDLNFKRDYDLENTITAMRDILSHGGPDDAGNYIEDSLGLALGHRRLSILDLSPMGHQPMEFENLVITYNGEVYNFREIRKELEREGYGFKSNSDTEVILKAFHRWGFSAVHKFRGMFAFAIWDREKKELILCRDRIGVKPLYWYHKDGLFMFASELKAFHKHPKFEKRLNLTALSLYLQYIYIPAPYSIFENTYKLKQGHFLVINSKGEIKEFPYWSAEEHFLKGFEERERWLKRPEEELAEELEGLLTESFKLRLVSDVPVGMFLSGGIDSSTVCALLSKEGIKLKTFTIGFYEETYNEAPFAKKVAQYLGTEHTELYCTPKEAFEIIPRLPELYDEPFGDSSAIPTFLVSKLAKEKVKVSLSADGGDEQFCGYIRYWLIAEKIQKLKKLPLKSLWTSLLDLLSPETALKLYESFKFILPKYTNFRDKYIKLRQVLKAESLLDQYDLAVKYFLEDDLKELGFGSGKKLTQWLSVNSLDPLSSMMLLDLKTYLPDDILVKVDRATMGVALEGREPFLDHKVVEWTSRLPAEFKYKNGKSKYLLRKVLYKYIPSEILERPKQGFGVPIYEWFKSELKGLYREYLDRKRIEKGGIFNPDEVERLLKSYLEDRGVNHNKLWLLFVFEIWRERWV
ncbi:asparagine synthase (glutamine-hydrolyzing) [Thermodesulfovibrio sp. 3907-1M]|uniref:asparagine synthase (glutamine-hydrolyzing) n=1 Tax=Thermodesulfovibrio autotrophicus TaxID=3118333 RepID=A0AAU8GY46_9BACT